MINRTKTTLHFVLALLGVSSLLLLGCTSRTSSPSKTVKAPVVANFAEGVSKLEELRDEIRTAFEAGTPHDCDEALHTAADILSALPELAMEETKFTADQLITVETASKSLFQQLAALHEGFHTASSHEGHDHTDEHGHDHAEEHGDHDHGDEHDHEHENGYTAVSAAIDTAISQLKSL